MSTVLGRIRYALDTPQTEKQKISPTLKKANHYEYPDKTRHFQGRQAASHLISPRENVILQGPPRRPKFEQCEMLNMGGNNASGGLQNIDTHRATSSVPGERSGTVAALEASLRGNPARSTYDHPHPPRYFRAVTASHDTGKKQIHQLITTDSSSWSSLALIYHKR